jgi:hypothetical protein
VPLPVPLVAGLMVSQVALLDAIQLQLLVVAIESDPLVALLLKDALDGESV